MTIYYGIRREDGLWCAPRAGGEFEWSATPQCVFVNFDRANEVAREHASAVWAQITGQPPVPYGPNWQERFDCLARAQRHLQQYCGEMIETVEGDAEMEWAWDVLDQELSQAPLFLVENHGWGSSFNVVRAWNEDEAKKLACPHDASANLTATKLDGDGPVLWSWEHCPDSPRDD